MKKSLSFMLALIMVLCMIPGVAMAATDTWDGTADTIWYNDTDTEFVLTTAEQLAGLAELVDGGNTFKDKTIKLDRDLNLYVEDANGEPISFEPIGSFSDNKAFEGTFDGQGNTISNMYQNGWALANGYWDGPEYGMGLFSLMENATVKNVNFDGASLPTEANIIGVVAGGAANCVFENINVTKSYLGNHSWYSGGIVGWAEGDVKFINCDVDENTVISSQWGDFNNANGGIIGGCDDTSTIYMKDCDVACVIDAYNDVTSAYEWYSYRSCGMLIGDTEQKDDPDGDNVGNAIAPNLTCENVTVTYGNWVYYHYCQFGSARYPFCRVEAGESTGAYGNARVGEYTDANGNKVVDDNHAHNDGEKHNELIVFDQLYGGQTGDRYCTYGTATHPGVTVKYALIHSTNAEDNFMNGDIYMSDDDIFEAVLTADDMAQSKPAEVWLEVKALDENKVDLDEKAAIEAVAAEDEIPIYMEINLYKIIGPYDAATKQDSTKTQITNLNKPITISLEIPEDKLMEGYTYYVIRVHDGKAERIDGKLEGNKLTFASDKFSTYALAYEEPAAPHTHSLVYKYDDDKHWQECSEASCPDSDKGATESVAHSYTNGKCVCGKEEPKTEDDKPEKPNPKPTSGTGIKVQYMGGNSFSTTNSEMPVAVEIDGVPVSFTGNGKYFTVSCIQPGADWVTVKWHGATVTTNFTPDVTVVCTQVGLPKTGDMPLWAAIAEFLGF